MFRVRGHDRAEEELPSLRNTLPYMDRLSGDGPAPAYGHACMASYPVLVGGRVKGDVHSLDSLCTPATLRMPRHVARRRFVPFVKVPSDRLLTAKGCAFEDHRSTAINCLDCRRLEKSVRARFH